MTTSRVRQQYEALPYPPRNPADEKQRLVRTVGDDLAELNHYCFRGRQSFHNGFRCLVAGGGTGDAAIFLAEQLRSSNAEIVYLDMSEASREIAEQRAACEHLDPLQRFAAAEKLSGNITKHSFYAARTADRTARIDDYLDNPALCIVLAGEMKGMHEEVHRAIVPGETLSITYTLGDKQEVFQLPGNAMNKRLFRYFDGVTPIGRMIARVKLSAGSGNPQAIRAELGRAFDLLHDMGWAYLCNAPGDKVS